MPTVEDTIEQCLRQAYDELKGQGIEVGLEVFHWDNPRVHGVLDIVDGIACCTIPDEETNYWPVAELADANRAKDRAVELYLLDQMQPIIDLLPKS